MIAAAVLLAAGLALLGLNCQLFWDDEANTAIYGRNLLELGRLTAWDGTNLVGYSQGGALGEDLGQELRVPSLPAYVAAAGMFLFGQTTFGGRIMFVMSGVVSVGLLGLWMRHYFGRRFPWYVPSLILALSPAYLLYIRNCRYYALGVMFSLLVWIVWTPRAQSGRLKRRLLVGRSAWWRYVAGASAILLLVSTHYLNAAAVLATLPVFFLDRRFRQREQYVLLAVIYAVTFYYGSWILITANPFAADYHVAVHTDPDRLTHFTNNLRWFLRDLGTHEFFPWNLAPISLLPWASAWSKRWRVYAQRGALLLAVTLAYLVTTTVLIPRGMGPGPLAEMRYVVPLISVGSAIGGLGAIILWRFNRVMGVMTFLLLVGTNVFHFGYLADRRDETSPLWPPTLYRYLAENLHDYETGHEAMIDLLRQLPPRTTVRVSPSYHAYPAMFYAPSLHYCDQLTVSKAVLPQLRAQLPDYL